MIELPLPTGGALWIMPHAIVAIHKAPDLGDARPCAMVYIAGDSFRVRCTVDEVRAAIAPKPAPVVEEPDDFGDFLAACTKPDADGQITARDLHDAAENWCRNNALYAWSYRDISRFMHVRGYPTQKGSIRYYTGLDLVVGARRDLKQRY